MKSLQILFFLFLSVALHAQTPTNFLETRCKEIADAKSRAKLELERLEHEEKSLQSQKVELRLKQLDDELLALEIAENAEQNRIRERYFKLKSEIRAKKEAVVIITPQTCAK